MNVNAFLTMRDRDVCSSDLTMLSTNIKILSDIIKSDNKAVSNDYFICNEYSIKEFISETSEKFNEIVKEFVKSKVGEAVDEAIDEEIEKILH